jgi:hypothetical protein
VRERPPSLSLPGHLGTPDPAARSGPPMPIRWRNWNFTGDRPTTWPSSTGLWTARRRDSKGGTLTDPAAAGLRLQILADYAAMRVPRDLL